jgi:serine/threonine-protein kinase
MPQSAIPQPGDIIAGKYRVERPIGRGGMGAVFEVSHTVTGKRFAIKWLMTEPTSNEDSVTRVVREAQVAGRCEHGNIVEVYDIDRDRGQLFMVMELLKGQTLGERLEMQGRQLYRRVCRLLLPCIEAVAEAHGAGIIHRDLKPANIFICQARGREPEIAKVLDFGVSRFTTPFGQFEISTQTKSGAVVGTPFYMSPEQMRGHPIDARADVYSMGVTLYEALSGLRPFDATSYGDLLLKITEARPTPLEQLVEGLPSSLSAAVKRAMAPDPAARFANMNELARALEPHAGLSSGQISLSQWHTENPSGDTPMVSETDLPAVLSNSEGQRAKRRRMWIGLSAASVSGIVAALYGWQTMVAAPASESGVLAPDPAAAAAPPAAQETKTQSAADPQLMPGKASPDQPAQTPELKPAQIDPTPGVEPTPVRGESTRHGRSRRGQSAASSESGDPRDDAPSRHAPNKRSKSRAPARLERDDF